MRSLSPQELPDAAQPSGRLDEFADVDTAFNSLRLQHEQQLQLQRQREARAGAADPVPGVSPRRSAAGQAVLPVCLRGRGPPHGGPGVQAMKSEQGLPRQAQREAWADPGRGAPGAAAASAVRLSACTWGGGGGAPCSSPSATPAAPAGRCAAAQAWAHV